MTNKALPLLILALLLFAGCQENKPLGKISDESLPIPRIEFNPKRYVCYKADIMPKIDGKLDETAWQNAAWTDEFVDIEGDLKPPPSLKTRAKMLWDDQYFYIGAQLEEPQVWAKLTERDAVIYHDNDFEVFIDPDGDTHEYYELEINALNTVWDLLLIKPYRDGGPAVNAWDIQGLESGIQIDGTLNNPTDIDKGWSVELAIPWSVLKECAHKEAPPLDGDQWRVNFSRVEWDTDITGGKYVKQKDNHGHDLPEHNWVWSPQGLIAMHYPEMWGFVQFTDSLAGSAEVAFRYDSREDIKWQLRQIYYAERTFKIQYGFFTDKLHLLPLNKDYSNIDLAATDNRFCATWRSASGDTVVTIDELGRIE